MHDAELLRLWSSYDEKLEASLRLNRQNAADITRIKVQSLLASMKPVKQFTLLVGIIWVLFLGLVTVVAVLAGNPFLWVSAGAVGLLNGLAIGIYLYQMILIHETDLSMPIWAAQERIAKLKRSTLWVTRILFLQLPFWTTFYLSPSMLAQSGWQLYLVQIPVTGVFAWAAWWLFKNIRLENHEKPWFRLIFAGREWTPLMQSVDLLEQLKGEGE